MTELDLLQTQMRTSAIKIHSPEDFEGMRRAGRLAADADALCGARRDYR
jgi:hypothetical protein